MYIQHRHEDFLALRNKFPQFSYNSFDIQLNKEQIVLKYSFSIGEEYFFYPQVVIPVKPFFRLNNLNYQDLEILAFHIGMIELISYWKASCSPLMIIKPNRLNLDQINWWKNLYFNGLGEFFFRNDIQVDAENFVEIRCESDQQLSFIEFTYDEGYIIPIGGGKDSAVTLELLKKLHQPIIPFIINPREATIETALRAGYSNQNIFEIHRSIHPLLLQLNDEGFLNGHTPFSALLAFYALIATYLSHLPRIALSNESSANETTIAGTFVNHQYSKSFQFEKDFKNYVHNYIHPNIDYFSFLRPLNELQIAGIFSRFPQFHTVFRSCNVGSKTNSWCGHCPKCLFAWIILEPFIGYSRLEKIFGHDLMNDSSLEGILKELAGYADMKPFECIGTIEEVKLALSVSIANRPHPLPALLEIASHFELPSPENLHNFVKNLNPHNFLRQDELSLLKQAIYELGKP